MKKFFPVVMLVSLFFFVSQSFAYDACTEVNPFVPCSFGQYNFDSYVTASHWNNTPGYTIFYLSEFAEAGHEINQNPNIIDVYRTGGYFNIYVFDGTSLQGTASAPYPITAWVGPDAPENPTLTINVEPGDGGNIALDGVGCTTYPCIYTLSEVNQSSIQATANTGYAFGYWKETANPYSVTPSGDKSMTAMFFRTFRNAVGDFYADIDDNGGECIVYVRSETGIDYNACHGDAMDCFSLAKAAGYSTGSEPKEGAIAVFSRDTFPDVGHVGIVKEIVSGTSIILRHSNYLTYHIVGEDTINLTTHPVMGYIYPTP